jgi:hypothetical protein
MSNTTVKLTEAEYVFCQQLANGTAKVENPKMYETILTDLTIKLCAVPEIDIIMDSNESRELLGKKALDYVLNNHQLIN